jgi:hypothetical protein
VSQGQLWNAGPVTIYSRSHKRGAPPVRATCREPGCSNPRRLVQGARYCEEHARGKNYNGADRNQAPSAERTCHCGRVFTFKKKMAWTDLGAVWLEFCPNCRTSSLVSRKQLANHGVPPDLARQWIALGASLRCELCRKKLDHPVHIDHDHAHCEGQRGCAECVRGPVHPGCNTKIAAVEHLRLMGLLPRMLDYIGTLEPHG